MAGRDDKRFPAWAPWVAGLVGGGLLVGAQLWLVRSSVEDDLTSRTEKLLAQLETDDPEAYAGYGEFDVTFHGRDGVVSGVPAGGASEASAGRGVDETLVKLHVGKLEGVRTVSVETLPVPGEDEADDSDGAGSDEATAEPTGAESTAAEPTAPATAEPTAEPTKAPEPKPAPSTSDGVAAQIADLPQIPFVSGAARWEDGGNAILAQMARAIIRGPADATYEIQGHTDSTGDPEANLALSQRRADAVRNELISRAVPAERLTAVGFGQTKPLVSPEQTDEDRATNRRVVVVVTGG